VPGWLTRWRLRARATLSERHDRELRDELQLHLQLLEDEYRAQGLPADLARRRAHREFGNPTVFQEASHDLFSFRLLEDVVQDLRSALRETRRSIGFTCIALLSLGLGIGAVTSAFSVLDLFMLRTLPVRDPGSLVAFSAANSADWSSWSIAPFIRWRDSPDALFEVAAASDVISQQVRLRGNDARDVRISLVSSSYFGVMGVDIGVGRDLGGTADNRPNGEAVAVISDAFWNRWFGRTPDVLTKTIDLHGVPYSVIGVARPGFTGHIVGHPVDIWVPLAMAPALMVDFPGLLEDRWGTGASWLKIVGRLRMGVGIDEARQSADLIYKRFVAEKVAAVGATSPSAARDGRQTVSLLRAANGFAPERSRFAWPLLILTSFTGLVLLVACANFTNLMLARSESRRREFIIRHALGASRWRLIRQSITECMALATLAGLFGLLFARWATTVLVQQFAIAITPVEFGLGIDGRVLAFTAACITVAMAFGVWPCTRAALSAGGASVSESRYATDGVRPRALGRRFMLIGQLTLCTALLIAAGLLLRTVTNLRHQDFGFDRRVLLVSVSPGQAGYSGEAAALRLRHARGRLLALPGVQAVGLSGPALLDSANYWIDGSQELTTDRGTVLPGTRWTFAAVGPGFFEAVGMSLLEGRDFQDSDARAGADAVVLNRSLATFLFGQDDPRGRRIQMNRRAPMQTVVGVVNDAKQTSPRDQGIGVVYLPLRQLRRVVLAVRTAGPPSAMVPTIREQLGAIASDLPIENVRTFADLLDEAIAVERLMSALALCLAALVITIGCLGLYALISYDVARRTHELGIRLALGATKNTIIAMVLKDGAHLVLAALAIGAPLGIAASRPLSSQLYGVQIADIGTLLSVAALLSVVALLATINPARRAARIDPIALLRHE
jgi:predicted permease